MNLKLGSYSFRTFFNNQDVDKFCLRSSSLPPLHFRNIYLKKRTFFKDWKGRIWNILSPRKYHHWNLTLCSRSKLPNSKIFWTVLSLHVKGNEGGPFEVCWRLFSARICGQDGRRISNHCFWSQQHDPHSHQHQHDQYWQQPQHDQHWHECQLSQNWHQSDSTRVELASASTRSVLASVLPWTASTL